MAVAQEQEAEVYDNREIAFGIFEDRRAVIFNAKIGDRSVQMGASQLYPGFLAVEVGSGDPIAIPRDRMRELTDLVAGVEEDTVSYPAIPRPCSECEGIESHDPDCIDAEDDRTIILEPELESQIDRTEPLAAAS